jgi:predicted nuclease of predicted toxin-antitoxin system
MASLLADENFPTPTVEHLRQSGHDVVTLLQLGKAGLALPDDEVLVLATSMNRCLLTLNRKDFIKLHNHSAQHAGILICTFDADFALLAERIDRCFSTDGAHPSGQLLRVQRPNV